MDVVVSSIVDAGRIFIQQPTHPSYTSLERLNHFMLQCYMQEGAVPDIPRPIESELKQKSILSLCVRKPTIWVSDQV